MNQALNPSLASTEVVLKASALCKNFGGIKATQNVSLALPRGARHALIGPNGAGKTTLINLLTGVLPLSSGSIELLGEDITRLRSNQRVKRGLVRTFQINQLFGSMSPVTTLAWVVTQHLGWGSQWWSPLGRNPAVMSRVDELLVQFHLTDVGLERVSTLSYGKQRLLEIAIALACEPKVLLLDEPVAGVPAGDREEILSTLAQLPGDVCILLIEHDMDLVFSFANRMTVLVNGALLCEGSNEEIANDPRVKEVYLGAEAIAGV